MNSQNTDALAIPDAAYTAGERAASRHFPHPDYAIDPVEDALNAAAPLVVAAELRRIADSWDHGHGTMTAPHEYVAESLRARADELDPGSPATTRED